MNMEQAVFGGMGVAVVGLKIRDSGWPEASQTLVQTRWVGLFS